jgi:uncharacterized membrane protein
MSNTMKHAKTTSALLIAGAVTVALSAFVTPAKAQGADREKCFGVADAGKNDCAAGAGTTCAGSSKKAFEGKAWKYVAKGTCATMSAPLSPTGKGSLEAFMDKKA